MIKKTENFQNFETIPVTNIDFIKNFLINNIHYIVLFTVGILSFFPKTLLIVNSIALIFILFILYKFFYIDTRFSGDGIFLVLYIPCLVILIISEIQLFNRVYNIKESELSDSD